MVQAAAQELGKKNCELSEDDITRICETFLAFKEAEQSKIFDNVAFGYWKVTVERPLRLRVELSPEARRRFRLACEEANEAPIANLVDHVAELKGAHSFDDFNVFIQQLRSYADIANVKLTAKRQKLLQGSLAERDSTAEPVIRAISKPTKAEPDPLRGLFPVTIDGKTQVVEHEPDSELRDTEQIPLQEPGGIEAFIRREVLPHAPDAWVDESKTAIGYEISFNRYFSTSPSRYGRWRPSGRTS